jgi:hypothetical protein
MVPHQYGYLLGDLVFFVFWLILYISRKDLRPEMWFMGILTGFLMIGTQYFWWTVDWWRPMTITGTRVGIEDFILGLTSGGIVAVVYEVIFGKYYRKSRKNIHQPGILTTCLLAMMVISFLFWGLRLSSPISSSIGMITIALLILYFRKDLFVNAIVSAILMTLLSLPVYYVISSLSTGWIDVTYLKTLSGIRVTGIPIEELNFWFLFGFVGGPIYEYWKGERLNKSKCARLM